jgi:hypothetical protein
MFNFKSIIAAAPASIYIRVSIPGYPGYYADTDGAIWSDRRGELRPMKPRIKDNGYPQITMQLNGRKVDRHIHDLVLTAFHGERPAGMVACHFPNNDKTDCRPANLMWGSRSLNWEHCKLHQTLPRRRTIHEVRAIRAHAAAGAKAPALAEQYDISPTAIRNIVKRKTHKGV